MSEPKIKRGRLKHVEDRVRAGICLVDDCNRSALSKDQGKCGICSQHYYHSQKQIDEAEDQLAEAMRLHYEGLRLLPHTIHALRNPNPFANVG